MWGIMLESWKMRVVTVYEDEREVILEHIVSTSGYKDNQTKGNGRPNKASQLVEPLILNTCMHMMKQY